MNRILFQKVLTENVGVVVIKFGAEWCAPCRKLAPIVANWKSTLPAEVQFFDLNIDEPNTYDLYSALKNKRQVNGIPAMLAYDSANKSIFPDASVSGCAENDIASFFNKVSSLSKSKL